MRFLILQPLDKHREPAGAPLVAADAVAMAGPGELVYFVSSREAAEERARQRLPARRLGTVEECASAAIYLCSVQAAYVTGTSILVDGALTQSV